MGMNRLAQIFCTLAWGAFTLIANDSFLSSEPVEDICRLIVELWSETHTLFLFLAFLFLFIPQQSLVYFLLKLFEGNNTNNLYKYALLWLVPIIYKLESNLCPDDPHLYISTVSSAIGALFGFLSLGDTNLTDVTYAAISAIITFFVYYFQGLVFNTFLVVSMTLSWFRCMNWTQIGNAQHQTDQAVLAEQRERRRAERRRRRGEQQQIANVGQQGEQQQIIANGGQGGEQQQIANDGQLGDQQQIANDGQLGDQQQIANGGQRRPQNRGPNPHLVAPILMLIAAACVRVIRNR